MRSKNHKRLIESLEFQLVPVEPNSEIEFNNMVSEWGGLPYPHLSVLLVHLQFLFRVHQTHHWISRGDSYYGDHLLFQRLYEETYEEIDPMAEKAIGLGMTENVHLELQISQLDRLAKKYGMVTTIPQQTELAKRSLVAELALLNVCKFVTEQLKMQGLLTRGLDNMIAGIEDLHESHVYLLKQRITTGA